MNLPYLEPTLRAPSLDAAAYLGDRIGEAEADARAKAQTFTALRAAEAAITAIPAVHFTPEVAARLVNMIRNRVSASSWAHFKFASDAVDHMDDAHDTLGAV